MPAEYTPAALAWLQTLLKERLGHAFHLQAKVGGKLALGLPSDARCITLVTDPATFTRTDSELACTQWDAAAEGWHPASGSPLAAPGAADLPKKLITGEEGQLHFNYDIFGLAYWMLNRVEEIGRTDIDNHGRFPGTSSHAFKHGYLERPVVDDWLHILGQAIHRVWPAINLKQHQPSVKVSHDVDSPSLYAFKPWGSIIRMAAVDLLRRHDLRTLVRAPYIKLASRSVIHPTDPYNAFEWMMDLSERYGLTSAFYFICGHTDPHDADYQSEDPRIRALMRRMHDRGHEIGLHASYGTYKNPAQLKKEADKLRQVMDEEGIKQDEIGSRQHYLRWSAPETARHLEAAGIGFDTTLGFADHAGFRCGTCHEYPMFDVQRQHILNLRQRPLILMEASVLSQRYMNKGYTDATLDYMKRLKATCHRHGGTFTLLWHNSHLRTENDRRFYQELIA
jgi:hypothetical protein